MKNKFHSKSTFTILSILLLIFFFGKKVNAQNCDSPTSKKVLDGNNISAIIQANGSLFWDFTDVGFVVPNNIPVDISTIFRAYSLFGAIDNQGQIKVSSDTSFDYIAGPINGNPNDCNNFEQLWEIKGTDIQTHIADFEDNGIIDNPILDIFNYPAQGNQYFFNTYGFTLPNSLQGLAPFYDENNDGIYDPNDGDFPLPEGVNKNSIPAHLIWGIYNDGHISNNAPLNIEIQITAWAFNCTDNELINNTIFTSHKITNGGTEALESMFFSHVVDFDIGCNEDDFFGSIPDLNTFYGYNKDDLDGFVGCSCSGGVNTYCGEVPAQAVTFLNQEMSSFISLNQDFCLNNPNAIEEHYNVMQGLYEDGSAIKVGGFGCQGTETTKFLFSDNPNDSQGWSMANLNNIPANNHKSVGNVSINSLPAGAFTSIDMAYSFIPAGDLNNLEVVDKLYTQIPNLQLLYDNQFVDECVELVSIEDENFQKSEFEIFPNPTTHLLIVKFEQSTNAQLSIFDIYGENIFQKNISNQKESILSLENLSSGIYFLNIKKENKNITQKFIKQ